MTHPNEALIRGWFAAQAKGDEAALRALMAGDIVWHVPGRSPLSADYRGPDEVLAFLARPRELSGGTVRPQLLALTATDEYAVALVRVYAERPGKKLDGSLQAWTFRIADGRIAEFWFLVEDRNEVDAFWSD
ncbi:MAG TPA: nuclear transport factor 2 family protein [Dehalococcoidia bacterium]|nr:nuclear transport factor 2 family protein [Dehalococcoidia bacterium]